MGLLARILGWWRSPRRRQRRDAERALDRLFRDRELLAPTSLRPDHRSRCQILDLSQPPRIGFGIVRHPRPFPFSPHAHEVVELWVFDPAARTLERVQGVNLTRARDREA